MMRILLFICLSFLYALPAYGLDSYGSKWDQKTDVLEPARDINEVNLSQVTTILGNISTIDGGGLDAATLNGEPGAFYLNYSAFSGNIKKENIPNWSTVVCEVMECNGVHTHHFGEDACNIVFKSISTVQIVEGCTVHLNGGTEYDFEPGTFTNINPDFVNSSVWIGINSTGIVQQSNEFTETQRLTIAPLARVQSEGTGIQEISTILDVRFKSSNFEWQFQNFLRNYIGTLAGGGLETSEVGTRNLALSAGTFADTEMQGHALPSFSMISGILIHSTPFSPVTTVKGLLQADNIQYDTGSGLADMTNNQWYASHNLAMSAAGGIVNEVDTGRVPTFFLIMSNGQWNSLGEALEQPFNLGPFVGSKEIVRLAKLVVQKNSAGITQIAQVQPFNTSGTGTGVAGTSSMQQVYINSPNGSTPEITTNTTNNDLTIRYGGDNGKIQTWQKSGGTEVFAITTSFHPGIYINTAFVPFSSVVLSTVIIPFDTSEPLITEGVEVRRIDYQPFSENSTLEISYHAQVATVTNSSVAECALFAPFINTTSIEAAYVRGSNGDVSESIITIYHEYQNLDTTEKLFTVRCGANAGNIYIGSPSTGADVFGNASNGALKIKEFVE
jgi:hypothetical protein